MNSDQTKPKLNLRSLYSEVQPDAWAISRLKSRLRQETKPSFDEIVGLVFRRYVLVASMVMLVVTIALEITTSVADESEELLTTWLYGELNSDTIVEEVPGYLFLTETMED
jgi:hypothetical protein